MNPYVGCRVKRCVLGLTRSEESDNCDLFVSVLSRSWSVSAGEWSMLRRLVVLYLVVVTLAGPRLCPCSVSFPEATPSVPSVPFDGAPRACGCGTHSCPPTRTVSPADGEQRPDQPPAPCQCQCGKQDSAATVRTGWRAGKPAADHDGFHGPVPGCHVPHPAPIHPVVGVGRLRDLPFCTTHDLLYAFHRLRC